MNELVTASKATIAEAIQTKAAEIAKAAIPQIAEEVRKNIIPTAGNFPISRQVKVREDFTVKQQKAEIMRDYFNAVIDRNGSKMDTIAREANNKFGFTRANFTTSDASAPVPQFWVDEVFSAVDKSGYARNLFRMVPMRSLTEKLTAGTSATAGIIAEGSATTVTDSTSFFTSTNLTAKEIRGAAIYSRAWMQDANASAYDFITQEIGNRIAYTEDVQAFNGSGSGVNFTGLINTSGVTVSRIGTTGNTAFSAISWKDLNKLRLSLNPTVQRNAAFACPQTVFQFLINEVDSTGRPIWQQSAPINYEIGLENLQADVYLTPTGRPIVVVPDAYFPASAADKAAVVLCDFSRFAVMGVRSDLEIQSFRESLAGVDLAGTNQEGIQLVERVAFAFPAPAAIGVLKTQAS